MPITDLKQILATLEPLHNPGVYVFATIPLLSVLNGREALGTFREAEAWTVVVTEAVAEELALTALFRAAWITLRVHSDLSAAGLTAAFSTALAEAGIACNVIAGAYHDHLFVPVDRADEALRVLGGLQTRD